MTLNVLIPLVALIAYCALLIVVIGYRPYSTVYRSFGLYLLAMVVWSFGSFMLHANLPVQTPLFWLKVMSVGTQAMPVAFFYFTQTFLSKKPRRTWIYGGLGIYAVLVSASWSSLIIKDAVVLDDGGVDFALTYLAVFPFLNWFCFNGFSAVGLARAYRGTRDPHLRKKIRYPLLGIGVVLLGVLGNFSPLGSYPVDIAANLINACLITYAIVRHELLDLNFLVRKSLSYATLTGALAASYLVLLVLFDLIFHRTLDYPTVYAVLISLAVVVPMSMTVGALYTQVGIRVDRLFFRERYDGLRMVRELTDQLATTLDLDTVAAALLDRVGATLHIQTMGLLLHTDTTGGVLAESKQGPGARTRCRQLVSGPPSHSTA